jgi:tripartite-type tricarboxylate transporter receptor subunit TctC
MLKVPVNVVNRAGGSGVAGINYVVHAKNDGYSLLAGDQASVVISPLLMKEPPFDPLKDLVPMAYLGSSCSVFAVRSDSPITSLPALIDYAKKNPGKLNNAVAGFGTAGQFNTEILAARNGLNIVSIPFRSGPEAVVAVLGGHADIVSSSFITLGPHIRSGRIRALAVSSGRRFPAFPEISTTTEAGHPYVNIVYWGGALFAPPGTPQRVLSVLVPALEKAFNDPQVIERARNAYIDVEYKNPADFRKYLEAEISRIAKIIGDSKLQKG